MKKALSLFMLFTFMMLNNSCKKSDSTPLSLNRTSLTLESGREFTLEARDEPNAIFTSQDNRIASVDANGVVKANIVGKTKILVSANGRTAECNITVEYSDDGFLVPPITKWGASKEEIKSMFSKLNPSSILKDENKVFVFKLDLSVLGDYIYAYGFEDNRLSAVMIIPGSQDFSAKITELKSISQFCIETYEVLGRYGDDFVCKSLDGKTSAVMFLEGNKQFLTLVPYKDNKEKSLITQSMLDEIKTLTSKN